MKTDGMVVPGRGVVGDESGVLGRGAGWAGWFGEPGRTLMTGGVLTLLIVVVYGMVGFSVLRSDVGGYAAWSHDLAGRSGGWHLPGYPLIIACVRWVTLGWVSDVVLMRGICLAAWVVGVLLVDRFFSRESPGLRAVGTLVWGLYPFVGVTNVAYPLADQPACTAFVAAVVLAREGRMAGSMVAGGIGLLVHMALWPFVLCFAVACVVSRRLAWWQVVVMGLPLAAYYGAMAWRAGDLWWFFRIHYRVNFQAHSGAPVFDALIGTFGRGGMAGWLKGCLLTGSVVAAVVLAWRSIGRRDWLMAACCVPLVLYGAVLNVQEGWALMRFGRLLVLPLVLTAPAVVVARPGWLGRPGVQWLLLAGLGASQFAWAMYEVRYHAAEP